MSVVRSVVRRFVACLPAFVRLFFSDVLLVEFGRLPLLFLSSWCACSFFLYFFLSCRALGSSLACRCLCKDFSFGFAGFSVAARERERERVCVDARAGAGRGLWEEREEGSVAGGSTGVLVVCLFLGCLL